MEENNQCFMKCYRCKKHVVNGLIVNELVYHKECVLCFVCHAIVPHYEIIYIKNKIFCPKDFENICFRCEKVTHDFNSKIMHTYTSHGVLLARMYHRSCFTCSICDKNLYCKKTFFFKDLLFCTNDWDSIQCFICKDMLKGLPKFYKNNKIICQKDWYKILESKKLLIAARTNLLEKKLNPLEHQYQTYRGFLDVKTYIHLSCKIGEPASNIKLWMQFRRRLNEKQNKESKDERYNRKLTFSFIRSKSLNLRKNLLIHRQEKCKFFVSSF